MIHIEFFGAARTVTGSKHLLRTSKATVLLDCGLFQGRREEAYRRNQNFPINVTEIDAVVLSHGHIDHSGLLPKLVREGYRKKIYTTSATRDLCLPMFLDTVRLMESDFGYLEKLQKKGALNLKLYPPLYDELDVMTTMSRIMGIPYHQKIAIAPGVELTLLDAGHVLGSAICVLDIEDEGERRRIAFTGDLGREELPVLRTPEVPENVDVLIMESTYGDRTHEPISLTKPALARIIHETVHRQGKVIIPSFALERAQEVIYILRELREKKEIPPIPVYVDSPLGVKITDVFKLHPECLDEEASKLLRRGHSPFDFDGLHYVSSVEESKKVTRSSQPSIVIAASGMCEGGRVLHHLEAAVESSRNTIIIVGFQAEYTLGRRLVEHREDIRIFGQERKLRAQVEVLNGFSGHADQSDLIRFAHKVKEKGMLKKIILVHGEPQAQDTLRGILKVQVLADVNAPAAGDKIILP